MSWDKFSELKGFAGKSSFQRKRQQKYGGQQPVKKRKKNSNDASFTFGSCEEDIEGFSSEEDVQEKGQAKPEQAQGKRKLILSSKYGKTKAPTPTLCIQEIKDANKLLDSDSDDSVNNNNKRTSSIHLSGLAERLQRLVNREKSDRAFWLHKQTERKDSEEFLDSSSGDTSTVTVQILTLTYQYSLHLLRCYILSDDDSGQIQQPPRIVDVVFDNETMKQLNCEAGSVVRIYPPWKKLEMSCSAYPMILCTYHCERLPTPPGTPPVIDIHALTESCLPVTRQDQRPSLKTSPRKNFHPTKLLFGEETSSSTSSNSSLAAVTPSEDLHTDYREKRVPRDTRHVPEQPTTIMRAIESQGGCSEERVSFRAAVQRVYWKRVRIARQGTEESPGQTSLSSKIIARARSGEEREELRWFLLLQDNSRTFCEVELPADLLARQDMGWSSCVLGGEGKSFVFSDLVVKGRTNKTRSPGLFSLMDSLWNKDTSMTSNNDDVTELLGHKVNDCARPCAPPCCSYTLRVQEYSQATCGDLENNGPARQVSLYKQPCFINLYGLRRPTAKGDTSSRVSCWCRVLCSRRTCHGQVETRWTGTQLFATDASLQRMRTGESPCRFCKIEVRASNGVTKSVQNALHRSGSLLLLKDLVYTFCEDEYYAYADSFTVIQKAVPDPSLGDMEKGEVVTVPVGIYTELMSLPLRGSLSPLSGASLGDSLCLIEGMVLGVDEDTACCWLVCPTCISADLIERTGLPYFCSICQCDVKSPVTKTHLEVFIECESWQDARVRVKLLQTTVEKLLPVSYQESEQGYDIECVLGKHLGPLSCYIECVNGSNITLEEITVAL